jgi:hypothetical protein
MTIDEKVDSLIEQAAALPEDAQVELVQSLLGMRSRNLGVDDRDETEG